MHGGGEHQAQRVDQDVALAAVDLLPAIKAPHATNAGGLDALTVDDARTRLRMPTGANADAHPQCGVEAVPDPGEPPASEPPEDGLPRWVLVRQAAPLAARADNIEDAVQDVAEVVLPRPPGRGRPRQVRQEHRVLRSRQVARVGSSFHTRSAADGGPSLFSNSL